MASDPEVPDTRKPDPEWDERPEAHQRIPKVNDLPDPGIYREFRHLAAQGELLDGYFASLARALRFSGQVRVEFRGGKILWTELREKWVDLRMLAGMLGDEGSGNNFSKCE